ncbi:hypothetical protein CUMW_036470 [Citrus unshiu]|nr:hypothetical protein CUMW_036470 [Citrus unshiu]
MTNLTTFHSVIPENAAPEAEAACRQQQPTSTDAASASPTNQSLYHPGLLAAPSAFLELGFDDSCFEKIEPIPSGNLPPGFDPSTCRSVYVGNIHTQVTEPLLQEVFSSTGPVEGCKLIRKDKSSYGFIHYFDRRSAAMAILSLNGRHLFGQPIKVNWAYASGQREDTSGHFNIFVGDLSPEVTDATLFACFSVYPSCSDARVMWDQKTGRSRGFGFVSFRNQQVTQLDLHRHFHSLGAGVIEEVRVQRDKGFGFVRYSTHAEAALAIQMGNTTQSSYLFGKQMKCSWGSKPTPPGTSSNPLPPPAAAPIPGLSAADLLAYERQIAMSKMGGVHALMHPQAQHPLKQAAMGVGSAGASQAIYDGGFQNVAAAQQLMYYQ